MRCMPIGLIYHGKKNRNKLIYISIMSSKITHNNPIGYLGGLASALFTALAFEEVDENHGGPEAELEQAEDIKALTSAIEKLPERSQQILALYYQEEMNLKEIGEILSVSESRISQILSETASKLRKLMTA